jgi:hypothetical protein
MLRIWLDVSGPCFPKCHYALIQGRQTEEHRASGLPGLRESKRWWGRTVRQQLRCAHRVLPPLVHPMRQRLIFYEPRRTAARNLRRAGVAERAIQKISGWRTRSVFDRYAIVTQTDIADAMNKLQSRQDGHNFGHSDIPREVLQAN